MFILGFFTLCTTTVFFYILPNFLLKSLAVLTASFTLIRAFVVSRSQPTHCRQNQHVNRGHVHLSASLPLCRDPHRQPAAEAEERFQGTLPHANSAHNIHVKYKYKDTSMLIAHVVHQMEISRRCQAVTRHLFHTESSTVSCQDG